MLSDICRSFLSNHQARLIGSKSDPPEIRQSRRSQGEHGGSDLASRGVSQGGTHVVEDEQSRSRDFDGEDLTVADRKERVGATVHHERGHIELTESLPRAARRLGRRRSAHGHTAVQQKNFDDRAGAVAFAVGFVDRGPPRVVALGELPALACWSCLGRHPGVLRQAAHGGVPRGRVDVLQRHRGVRPGAARNTCPCSPTPGSGSGDRGLWRAGRSPPGDGLFQQLVQGLLLCGCQSRQRGLLYEKRYQLLPQAGPLSGEDQLLRATVGGMRAALD